MESAAEEVLPEIVRRLVAEFDPEQIILFGSCAWGEPRPDSDYDLLVIVAKSEEKPTRRATRGYRCLRKIGVANRSDREHPRANSIVSAASPLPWKREIARARKESCMDEAKRELVREWLMKASQ